MSKQVIEIILFSFSVRKNADDLKEAIEKVLAPMFCCAMTIASDDQKSKLDKVIAHMAI